MIRILTQQKQKEKRHIKSKCTLLIEGIAFNASCNTNLRLRSRVKGEIDWTPLWQIPEFFVLEEEVS